MTNAIANKKAMEALSKVLTDCYFVALYPKYKLMLGLKDHKTILADIRILSKKQDRFDLETTFLYGTYINRRALYYIHLLSDDHPNDDDFVECMYFLRSIQHFTPKIAFTSINTEVNMRLSLVKRIFSNTLTLNILVKKIATNNSHI